MNQSNSLTVSLKNEYAIKVGTKERLVTAETVMVKGGKMAAGLLAEVGFASAYTKAQHGNFRAAVEIMSFGATPSQVKGLAPQPNATGQVVWTRARVAMLAELVLDRKPADDKAWSKQALKGRTMATLVKGLFDKPPVVHSTPADDATDATIRQPDALAGLEPALM
jgi:hypothetical protein